MIIIMDMNKKITILKMINNNNNYKYNKNN